jgi:signal transduction histidine kinase
VNYFAFESDMRNKITDLLKPCLERQLEDREKSKELEVYFNKLSRRVQSIEAMFNQQRGRNQVFDMINDRILAAEVLQAQNQQQNDTEHTNLQMQMDNNLDLIRKL